MLKIQNGETRKVIILAKYEFRGWEKFGECLQSFFSKTNSQKGTATNVSQKGREFQRANLRSGEETSPLGKDTRLAAVIIKNRSQTSWRTIKGHMQRKVGRSIEVVPFADDRVVFGCANEREMTTVLERSDLYKGSDFLAKIKKWNMYLH